MINEINMHRIPHIVSFSLYQVFRKGKDIDARSGLEAGKGWKQEQNDCK
jgi:hypothetical protein